MVRQLGLFSLGQRELQNTILKFGVHILGLYGLADIEAAAALAGVTLLPDVAAFLLFVFVQTLGGADGVVEFVIV